jgi:hypothetical protein
MNDPKHVWEDDREWCMVSRHEIVEKNLECPVLQMFGAVLEFGRDK